MRDQGKRAHMKRASREGRTGEGPAAPFFKDQTFEVAFP